MELTVRHQVTFQWERSAAFLTDERSFPRVHASVCYEVMFQRERLFTFATLVRSLGAMEQ